MYLTSASAVAPAAATASGTATVPSRLRTPTPAHAATFYTTARSVASSAELALAATTSGPTSVRSRSRTSPTAAASATACVAALPTAATAAQDARAHPLAALARGLARGGSAARLRLRREHCGGRSATSLNPGSKEARRLKRKRRSGRARPRTRQLGGRRLMGPPSPTRRMPRVACRESAACPAARSPPTYRCSPRGRGWLCCCMRWRSPRVWRYSQPPEALRSHTRTTLRTLSSWVAMRTRGICTLTHWRGRAYTPKTATAVQ